MPQTHDVAVAVPIIVPVAVATPVTIPHARVKSHLALQTPHPSEATGFGNSYGCWRYSSLKTTSSMSNYMAARVKQL